MKVETHIVESDPVDEWISQEELDAIARLLARVKVHNGQKLWEINLATATIKPAEFEKTIGLRLKQVNSAPIRISGIIKKVIVRRHCIYVAALNPAMAAKKGVKRIDIQ